MKNVELVKEMYTNFSTGNVPAVLAAFDAEIEWHECVGMPFVTGDGIFKGPDAILSDVFMQLGGHYDGFNISVTDVFGDGDKVAMVGYYQGTNKATGNDFKANAAHIWTFKEGKIIHFFQAVDTAATMR
jgi:ketosteroid isomerase-like protein